MTGKDNGVALLEVTAELPFLEVDEVRALVVVGRERGYLSFEEISSAIE